eukprot:6472229-Amphidinium_carterae.1
MLAPNGENFENQKVLAWKVLGWKRTFWVEACYPLTTFGAAAVFFGFGLPPLSLPLEFPASFSSELFVSTSSSLQLPLVVCDVLVSAAAAAAAAACCVACAPSSS